MQEGREPKDLAEALAPPVLCELECAMCRTGYHERCSSRGCRCRYPALWAAQHQARIRGGAMKPRPEFLD